MLKTSWIQKIKTHYENIKKYGKTKLNRKYNLGSITWDYGGKYQD